MQDVTGAFVIISALSQAGEQMVLAMSSEAGGLIHLEPRFLQSKAGVDAKNQSWRIVRDGPAEVFKIVSMLPPALLTDATEQVLDVMDASREDHGIIQIYPDHGGQNQRWFLRLVDADAGMRLGFAFVIISQLSGRVIDVPNASIDDGQQGIQQYGLHEVPPKNQQWILDSAQLGGGG